MKLSNLFNESNNSNVTVEHVKGGLDSYYQLTKAKELAKADGHDYDKLPEYHRGKDQPHKEKYKALAKEVNEVSVPYSKSTEKDLADRIAKKDDERKRVKKSASNSLKDYKKKMKANDDWKDTAEGLVGNVAGSLAGSVAGSVGGPGGSLAGGVAGGMAGDKLGDLVKKKLKASQQDEVDLGPTWKDDLEAALDGYPEWAHEYIKDGVCPECGGNGYMDGDYENEDGEENDECSGMYNYDCDEGEIRDNTWADELKSKEPQAPKQPAPSKEQIMKLLPMLHKEYVQSGRYNAFELGSILKQMYPELNKREAGSYVADFLSNYKPEVESMESVKEGPDYDASDIHRGDVITCKRCKGKGCDHCDDKGVHVKKESPFSKENADTQTNEDQQLTENPYIIAGASAGARILGGIIQQGLKRPITTTVAYDAMDGNFETTAGALAWLRDAMTPELFKQAGRIIAKYGVPAAGIAAAVYGGKKLADYIADKKDSETNEEELNDLRKRAGLKKESAPYSEPSQQEEAYNTLITAYENGEEDLAEVLGLSMEELDQEMTEFAMERGLHMDDDRDEVVHGYIEQVVDNADYKDHGEYESVEEGAPVEFDNDSNEAHVAKMLAKALGDENRWSEMSAVELYAELESQDPDVADMLHKVAMTIYDIKLKERVYKNQGTSDAVTDTRGKDFQFDKSNKKFKSLDGEEAAVNTKLGKDLLRRRRNQMKRTNPSYPKNKA